MSVNFTAFFSHSFDQEELSNVEDFLNRAWTRVGKFLPVLDGYPISGQWKWEKGYGNSVIDELHKYPVAHFDGPECFRAMLSPRLFSVSHLARWHTFITNTEVRNRLRGVCLELASSLNSPCVIYLPDSGSFSSSAHGLMYEDAKLLEVIDWLWLNCGPPADSIQAIYPNDYDPKRGEGYFIEQPPSAK
jgi:hypothetical protein